MEREVRFPVFGVWRSLVARFVRDEEAAGSSPATPTGERKQREGARGCGCCHAGVCGGIGGALGVCGWRLCVCARVLSVLVSKLGPVWVGRLRVSAHAGWAGRWCGWCACVPLVGRIVVAWLSLVFVSAPLFLLPVWWNGRHARLKSGCPVGRASSSLATGTGTTQNA